MYLRLSTSQLYIYSSIYNRLIIRKEIVSLQWTSFFSDEARKLLAIVRMVHRLLIDYSDFFGKKYGKAGWQGN
jgi:hypothetical protein